MTRTGAIRAQNVDLRVQIGDLVLANPIVSASGTFASGQEINQFFDVNQLGAVAVKSITMEPRAGLPTPRMAETASGMLNAIGQQNPGLEHWLRVDYPWLVRNGVAIIASITGESTHEYRVLAEKLRGLDGIVAIEANISAPIDAREPTIVATDPGATHEVLSSIMRVATVPVLAKLSPDVTDIVGVAHAAAEAGAAGVSVINTVLGMAIDVETRRPKLAAGAGGLSGPAIKPIAIRAVHQIHSVLPDLPIIGMGGARTVEDVVEFMLAGASAVGIGTATFSNPLATLEIVQQLPEWLAERGIQHVRALTGGLKL
ncbi:dihydroorotate dehydrogenase [Euzebya tangerina]|uniref:dihydroorotate dehydrogenase n=1 Tax=Euzebya tangerina TaxID=591198 RepID=UPI00196AE7A7|nr:dihydroorotate dehydrogenase [Euzebya tangerina]